MSRARTRDGTHDRIATVAGRQAAPHLGSPSPAPRWAPCSPKRFVWIGGAVMVDATSSLGTRRIRSAILTAGTDRSMTARAIPSIDRLTLRPGVQVLVSRYGHGAVTEA